MYCGPIKVNLLTFLFFKSCNNLKKCIVIFYENNFKTQYLL